MRYAKWLWVVGLSASFGLPLLFEQDYLLNVFFRVALFAGLGLAWNLIGGYTGQLSLGHAAFFGIGGYGLAIAHGRLGIGPWPSLAIAIAVSVAAAMLIGGVAFRLRGPYFALSTIAFSEVLRNLAKNSTKLTGGDVGLQVPALFGESASRSFCWAALLLVSVGAAISWWVTNSRFGYYLLAIREDEDTARAVGVNATSCKLRALALSAALTAAGGGLYASMFLFIVPDQMLSIDISNEIAIVAMLGGASTLAGPIVGAVVLELSAESFKNWFQEAHLLIYGLLIVLVVLFMPEGIVGTWRQRRRFPTRACPAIVRPNP